MAIITTLLDTDFYKFTMAQLVWKKHRTTRVTYRFINRTKDVPLARHIDIAALKAELERIRQLHFAPREIEFLRSSDYIPKGLFKTDFLIFLKHLALPPVQVGRSGNELDISVTGTWPEAIWWETLVMSVVNEMYCERQKTPPHEGSERLQRKIELLAKHPDVSFADFGTRRRASSFWHMHALAAMNQVLPQQVLGTSNVKLARLLGLPPIGTFAHELFMGYAAEHGESDLLVRTSHGQVLKDWWDMYGERLSIALTDTFGSEFFFRDMTAEQARTWRGLRQDSGDPVAFGERAIRFYESHGVDPRAKTVVFSDGLDVETMIKIESHFRGRVRTVFGWGTNLTNDIGVKPLSIVVKVTDVNGRPTVKLSDNPAKALGPSEEVSRYKRIFDYREGQYQKCVY